jgi:hypothetical protein
MARDGSQVRAFGEVTFRYVKLQLVEGMWHGFDFNYFHLDRIYWISRNFFACGEGLFGRRPHDPNDPVDPVQLFSLK